MRGGAEEAEGEGAGRGALSFRLGGGNGMRGGPEVEVEGIEDMMQKVEEGRISPLFRLAPPSSLV